MHVTRNGDFFRIVRITGPSHNMLSLLYGTEGLEDIEVLDDDTESTLEIEEVRKQVLAGVSEANIALDKNYRVERIQFLRSDSSPVEIYRTLAFELTKQMAEMTAYRIDEESSPQ